MTWLDTPTLKQQFQEILEKEVLPPTCETCDSPEECLGGTCPCSLCGEFIADVPRDTANKMLEKLNNFEREQAMNRWR
jgi:hypothetical protein